MCNLWFIADCIHNGRLKHSMWQSFHVDTFIDSVYITWWLATFYAHTLIDSLYHHKSPCNILCTHFDWQFVPPQVPATFYAHTLIDSLYHHKSLQHSMQTLWLTVCTTTSPCNILCTHFDWQFVPPQVPAKALRTLWLTVTINPCNINNIWLTAGRESLQHPIYIPWLTAVNTVRACSIPCTYFDWQNTRSCNIEHSS